MRRGERAGHHRRGGLLAHALDRDPLLARRAGVARPDGRRGRGAGRGAPVAPRRSTSARVIDAAGPVPVTVARSTPRSLASLRTGGLASDRDAVPVRTPAAARRQRVPARACGHRAAGCRRRRVRWPAAAGRAGAESA